MKRSSRLRLFVVVKRISSVCVIISTTVQIANFGIQISQFVNPPVVECQLIVALPTEAETTE